MNGNTLAILNISCEYSGLVKINDGIAGETGTENIVTPVSGNGVFYISFAPLSNDNGKILLPFTRKISLKGDVEIWDDDGSVEVYRWPGNIYEIHLRPYVTFANDQGMETSSHGQFSFQLGSRTVSACIYRDYQSYILIEEERGGKVVFAYPLWFDTSTCEITLKRTEFCAFLLFTGRTVKDQTYALILQIRPDIRYIDGCVNADYRFHGQRFALMERNEEIKGIYNQYLYEITPSGFQLKKMSMELSEVPPFSDLAIPCLFLSRIKNREKPEALSLLTADLLDGLEYEDICEFIGDFSRVTTTMIALKEKKENSLALIFQKGKNIYDVRVLAFELYQTMEGNFLIDNIEES